MPLETGNEIQDMNPAWPTGSDPKNQGDNHLQLIKRCVQGSFPGMSAPWTTDQQMSGAGYDAQGNTLINVADPVNGQDAVNLQSLQAVMPGVMSYGVVRETGGSNHPGSGDWSSVRLSEGTYRVTFNLAANTNSFQCMTATPVVAGNRVCQVNPQSTTVVEVTTERLDNGNAEDTNFSFIRMIPS